MPRDGSTRPYYYARGRARTRRRGSRRISSSNSGISIPTSPTAVFASTPLPPSTNQPSESSAEISDLGSIDQSSSSSEPMSSRSGSLTEGVSLESVFELCRDTASLMRAMNTKLRGVEEKTLKLATSLKEVNDYIKTYCSQPFAIKGSRFEGHIKTEVAKLFLLSLGRKPEDSDVKAALVRILGRENVRDRKKFDAAYTYAKNKLTDYRTEERRKVVGGVPCENACYEDTATLKQMIIDSLLPAGEEFSDDDKSTYHKHLAILRKFVRDSPFFPATNFYAAFREWLDTNYHTLDDTEWTQILDEDKDVDYATIGCGIDSEVIEQVVGNEQVGDTD